VDEQPRAPSNSTVARDSRGRRAAAWKSGTASASRSDARATARQQAEQAEAVLARGDRVEVVGHAIQRAVREPGEPQRQLARPCEARAGPGRHVMAREPRSGHVAASGAHVHRPVEQMFVSWSASPTTGASASPALATSARSAASPAREESGEHLAHAAGHDVAVRVQLRVVVQVGTPGPRSAARVAKHRMRGHRPHAFADVLRVAGIERVEHAQQRGRRASRARSERR